MRLDEVILDLAILVLAVLDSSSAVSDGSNWMCGRMASRRLRNPVDGSIGRLGGSSPSASARNLMPRCYDCKDEKLLDEFSRDVSRKNGRKSQCKKCSCKASVVRAKNSRKRPEKRAHWICVDSRHSDKQHARLNDLTVPFVQELIENGCLYCGETEGKLSVDRRDNTLGHLQSNVVACCVRCNMIRRDMPMGAWMVLVPAIRLARENGLFETWTGHFR